LREVRCWCAVLEVRFERVCNTTRLQSFAPCVDAPRLIRNGCPSRLRDGERATQLLERMRAECFEASDEVLEVSECMYG
jgi:hypothetical protein